MRFLYFILAFLLTIPCAAQTWSGVISTGRAIDWSNAGVSGGIPSGSWTQCGSTISAGASASTINTAIAACGTNQYVLLGAGTFNLTSGLIFDVVNNVALRGAGANQTLLVFTGSASCQGLTALICFESSDTNYYGAPSNIANWTAGYSAGSTSLTLSSTTNLAVGSPITLDQLDDTSVLLNVSGNWTNTSGNVWQVTESTITPIQVEFNGTVGTSVGSIGAVTSTNDWYYTGTTLYVYSTSNPASAFSSPGVVATTDPGMGVFVCYTPTGVCSTGSAGGAGDNGGGPRTGRSQQQLVTVTSISGSGPYTIGISPGLYMPNWASGKTPQAWWATHPISNSGVENLSIDGTSASASMNVQIFNCKGCWVKGVRSIDPGRSHVQMLQSVHITIQDSYFYINQSDVTAAYGIEAIPASDSLIQNNIFEAVTAPYTANGSCSGCVFAYNFDVNEKFDTVDSPTFQNQSGFTHAVGDENILFEGNQGTGFYSDNFHGSHHFITFFRNSYSGFQQNNGTITTNPLTPIIINAFSRFYNVIGNVLGSVAISNIYENTTSDANSGNAIYSVGFGDLVPNDSNTTLSLMRWGNYTAITQSSDTPANSGIRFVSSEVPSGITAYPNSVPSNNTLPASFYLSSKPAWWPSAKPWPSIGPDVTSGNLLMCTSGTYKGGFVLSSGSCTSGSGSNAYNGHAYTIPAADCYISTMGGNPIGTSGLLTFNASTCYTVTSGAVGITGNVTFSGKASITN